MIKVAVVYREGSLVSLEAKGHAESGPYGADLVCAAISAIIVGGFNALDDEKNYSIAANSGHASLKVLGPMGEHDRIVVETILRQVESVAQSYKENVTLERKNEP
jgi:uncharacterized protein YsxB (DUF464 family)